MNNFMINTPKYDYPSVEELKELWDELRNQCCSWHMDEEKTPKAQLNALIDLEIGYAHYLGTKNKSLKNTDEIRNAYIAGRVDAFKEIFGVSNERTDDTN
jgi:tRNA U34 5-carboxymethylaminomethyl modifying enzyme MnmG/GidA